MKKLETILEDAKKNDEHHLKPRAEGGEYSDKNISTHMTAFEHRDFHGNTPYRIPEIEYLKSIVEKRTRYLKIRNTLTNKLIAYKRHMDDLPADEIDFYTDEILRVDEKIKEIEKSVKIYIKTLDIPIIEKLRKIKGIGDLYIAVLITYLDPSRAPHISSFWAYAGYHGDSTQRYTKGKKGGGNKAFRTELFKIASNFLRNKNEYYAPVFYSERERLEKSEMITKERAGGGKINMIKWCDATPNHRRFAATRKMIKLFLAHLWIVWRESLGLPISQPYSIDKLGHKHIKTPEEFGW